MRIKDQKDFYAGLTFIVFGGLAMWLSGSYNMGTAARMGPGYFPYLLGGVLTFLGAIVLVKSLSLKGGGAEKADIKPMIVFVTMMVLSLLTGWVGLAGPNGSLAIGTVAGCALAYFFRERSLGLVLGAVAVFGLFLKGLGVIICTVLLVFISAFASHEFKFKETLISSVVLSIMAWAIFIQGLGLQMPTWVDWPELQRMFQSDAKPAAAETPAAAPADAPAAGTPAAAVSSAAPVAAPAPAAADAPSKK
jgi:Tripartite tricarboxylate transporter TctB family